MEVPWPKKLWEYGKEKLQEGGERTVIEVEMNQDIREYEPKILWGLTGRQIKYIGIGIVIDVTLLILFHKLSISIRVFAIAVVTVLTFVCGSTEIYGMPVEQFILLVFRKLFLIPRKRVYTLNEGNIKMLRKGKKKKVVRSNNYKAFR